MNDVVIITRSIYVEVDFFEESLGLDKCFERTGRGSGSNTLKNYPPSRFGRDSYVQRG